MSDQITDVPKVNPLLQKIKLPGRIFQLPSRGVFYTNGELAGNVKNGEIHVHAMSAIDEINMKNPDMLFSGKAIEEVCKTCIPSILNPQQLLARDVDALMLFLRVVTYGPYFEIDVEHTCENAKKQTYTINIDEMITKMEYLDPTVVETNYSVHLDNDQVINLRPAKYEHVIQLLQANESKTEFTSEDIQKNIIANLLNLIHDIDGITDREQIEEWIRTVPVTYINRIADKVDQLNKWGPQVTTKLVCRDCSSEMEIDIPLNPINFFSE